MRLGGVLSVVLLLACGKNPSPVSTIPQPSVANTLYARLGGIEVLRTLVDEWLLEVTSDHRIKSFFVEADISRLKLRLVERICVLVQGPCMYQGRELFAVHQGLSVADSDLRAFVEDLEPAMLRAKIDSETAAELRQAVRGLAAELALD